MAQFTLTKLRADVLDILRNSNKPLKAYEILYFLRKIRPGAQPPTVYRVLDFLKNKDVIHEVTNQHTYVLCQANKMDDEHPLNILLICSNCESVVEDSVSKLVNSIKPITKRHCFKPNTSTLELVGLCKQCQ